MFKVNTMGIKEASLKQYDPALAVEILSTALSLPAPKEEIVAPRPEMNL